jgi:folate-binding protein YgfZ
MMADAFYTILEHRGLLAVAGEDRKSFLQGMLTNDIMAVAPDRAVWSALLTPQGKFLHDLFAVELGDTLYLEGEQARLDDLKARLSKYKLRAKVQLAVVEGWEVAAAFGTGAAASLGLPDDRPGAAVPFGNGDGVAFTDPRLPGAGVRLMVPTEKAAGLFADVGLTPADFATWDARRIALGLPDGSRDIEIEKGTALESGFDELHGVDFKKGCYIGQELTARMKYRGLAKKRLVPLRVTDGPTPAAGTPVTTPEGKEAGTVRSAVDGHALALVRLEHLNTPLTAGPASLAVALPDWVRLPEPKETAAR